MAKHNEQGTLRKRNVIAQEIFKYGVSEQNKWPNETKKLTTNPTNEFKNIFSENQHHKETRHVNVKAIYISEIN